MINEDPACIKKLSKPSKQVLDEGIFIGRESAEKRLGLWNKIRMNRDRFVDGECGEFLEDLDIHFRGIFDASLLCLALSFRKGDYPDITGIFTDREFNAYEHFERMRVIEIYSVEDLKKKILKKDSDVLEVLRNYYTFGDSAFEEIFESLEIRPSLRYFFNKRWTEIKKKINGAVSVLILESDYLVRLIGIWEAEGRRIAEISGENERRKALDEIKSSEEELSGEIDERDDEIIRHKEDIDNLRRELKYASGRKLPELEDGEDISRYVTSEEAY